MKCKALTLFVSPIYGNVKQGDVLVVSDQEFANFKSIGLVEALEQKQAAEPMKSKPVSKKAK